MNIKNLAILYGGLRLGQPSHSLRRVDEVNAVYQSFLVRDLNDFGYSPWRVVPKLTERLSTECLSYVV